MGGFIFPEGVSKRVDISQLNDAKLLKAGKKVFLFATARRVSRELSELRKEGLVIFDIQKIRNFICWNKEIKSKRDFHSEAPKL